MDKMILSVLIGFLCLEASAQHPCLKDLTGRWQSVDGAGLEVVDSSRIYILYGEQKKQVSSFQADFSKTPCWFDFTIRDSTETVTMKSLLLIVSDNLVQWQLFDEGTRPAAFSSDHGQMVFLRRQWK